MADFSRGYGRRGLCDKAGISERGLYPCAGGLPGRRIRGRGLRLCAQAGSDGGEEPLYRVLLLVRVHAGGAARRPNRIQADDADTARFPALRGRVRRAGAVQHHGGLFVRGSKGDIGIRLQPDRVRVADEPDRVRRAAGYAQPDRLCDYPLNGRGQLPDSEEKSRMIRQIEFRSKSYTDVGHDDFRRAVNV